MAVTANKLQKRKMACRLMPEVDFPGLEKLSLSGINQEICERFSFFTGDSELLATALVQNPFGITKELGEIKQTLGNKVYKNLKIINRMQAGDHSLRLRKERKLLMILFLINYRLILEKCEQLPPRGKRCLSKKRIAYASKLLERVDYSSIRNYLEDRFFEILDPKLYNYYASLAKKGVSSRKEIQIKKELQDLAEKNQLKARIESRSKSMWSMHKKVLKKDILPDQITDVIGLRVITQKKQDCYTMMGKLLSRWPMATRKVKDYIALPKTNGYQSIHLTFFQEGHSIEIQIRTNKMHQEAQFGRASHKIYKK